MEKSNLRLFSNICPWKGRWKEGDQEFMARIWDDKALGVLRTASDKKEVTLTPYQEELYQCTIQCSQLPKGERPWGWIGSGKVACFCRNKRCSRFSECRGSQGALSEKELTIWSGGNQEGLAEFERTWKINKEYVEYTRHTGNVDLIKVFGGGEYDAVKPKSERPYDPKVATDWPDDEEYE